MRDKFSNYNEMKNEAEKTDKPQGNGALPCVSHSCICCGKEIKKLDGLPKDKDWEGMWDGGIVERISAGYGSLLDGDMYILAICDDCVKLKQLKYVGNYMFPDNCG